MVMPIYYENAIEFYKIKNKKHDYPMLVGENIEGDRIRSFEEWNNHPFKDEINKDVIKFKKYLRTLCPDNWFEKLIGIKHKTIGRCNGNHNNFIKTPILCADCDDIYDFINTFESTVVSKVEKTILNELKNATYSSNVFCHNALYYKSFVLKNNKLIGITNWQYAGFYPPEFEEILSKYFEYIF